MYHRKHALGGLNAAVPLACMLPQSQQVFDGGAYVALYPDVARAGTDPWVHWTNYGYREGRTFTYTVQALQTMSSCAAQLYGSTAPAVMNVATTPGAPSSSSTAIVPTAGALQPSQFSPQQTEVQTFSGGPPGVYGSDGAIATEAPAQSKSSGTGWLWVALLGIGSALMGS